MIYGKKRYEACPATFFEMYLEASYVFKELEAKNCEEINYLKPIAEEERRIEAEEKKKREELERIAKALAEDLKGNFQAKRSGILLFSEEREKDTSLRRKSDSSRMNLTILKEYPKDVLLKEMGIWSLLWQLKGKGYILKYQLSGTQVKKIRLRNVYESKSTVQGKELTEDSSKKRRMRNITDEHQKPERRSL
ncbi:hypothetical protein JD844_009615 [Phrynosoma platyrhinos]|uniref:Uncharacterized protein n=1 Tax=Phrynosoma platyrhinos TaxID=52577 RepID=A0ABQ7TFN5_PHRPL|nr:hypothetical protein JD844_009615 [Phrynosoma platyrhinos]